MPKINETKKKLRYDRRKDSNTNCYIEPDGSYVFTVDVKRGNRWEKQEVLRFHPEDYPNGAEIILALTEYDRKEDVQEEALNDHRDKVFGWKLSKYETAGDDTQSINPWDEAAYARDGRDILDEIFPEDLPEDERKTQMETFIRMLQPQQADLFYGHYGERKTLEELRQEEMERTGKPVTQQAFSCRWNKIVERACKYFGVSKPRKRAAKDT